MIYAARSEQYRRAYIQYLKTTLPWLFKISSGSSRSGGRRQRPNIFIINSVQSAPQLTSPSKGTKGSIKLDLKVCIVKNIISSKKSAVRYLAGRVEECSHVEVARRVQSH